MNGRRRGCGNGFFLALTMVLLLVSGPVSGWAVQHLPDLTIKNVKLDRYCFPVVDVANIGEGWVPASTWPHLQVEGFLDGSSQQAFDGYLRYLDPNGYVQHPGGSMRVFIKNWHFPAGTHRIRVRIYSSVDLEEANTGNNELIKSLTCSMPLPDLAVTELQIGKRQEDGRCFIKATIKNIGRGWIPENEFQHASIRKGRSPGMRLYLHNMSGAAAVMSPGGEFSFNPLGAGVPLKLNQGARIIVWVDEPSSQPPYASAIAESNENNNKVVRVIRCWPKRTTARPPANIVVPHIQPGPFPKK